MPMFQFMHPHRKCDLGGDVGQALQAISTLTPYTGCDRRKRKAAPSREGFQLAHPIQGTTRGIRFPEHNLRISIHAPRTGAMGLVSLPTPLSTKYL